MDQKLNFIKMRVLMGNPDITDAPRVVIGRTQLVDALWRKLMSGSLCLLSERRMGKTWVLILAQAKRPNWAVPFFMDVEDINSATEFVLKLNKGLHRDNLIPTTWWEKVQDWFRRHTQRLQEKKIGSIEIPKLDPWGVLLEDTCRKFIDKSEGKQSVLMIDELPFFLDKIIKNSGPGEAIEILDTLRSLRQSMPSLRMVFCGSLGLHIVLQKLREAGYAGRPVNDMFSFEVPPLDPKDAYYLCGCLLHGEGIKCSDIKAVAEATAQVSCGVPFFIQSIVSWMGSQNSREWNREDTISVLNQFFNIPEGHSIFSYYNDRLDVYYSHDIVDRARAALDVLSRNKAGMHFDNLLNLVRHRPKTLMIDSEVFLDVMHILRDDHYVINHNGQWSFKLEIVR